jgi:hypothetical protein
MLRSYHASFFVALSYVHVIAHFVPGAVVANGVHLPLIEIHTLNIRSDRH